VAGDQRSRHHDRYAAADGPAEAAITDRVEAALRIISSLSGLAQENMTQLAGWRFLELGRRIERALLTCRLVRCFAEAGAPDGRSRRHARARRQQISYRQRYVMIAALAPGDRSGHARSQQSALRHLQLDRIETHLGALPRKNSTGRLSAVQQIAASIATQLRTADAAKIDDALIMDIEQSLMKLSDAISAAYLTNNERSDSMWEALS